MRRFASHALWLFLCAAGVCVGLSGCGQKGNLYMPEPERPGTAESNPSSE